MGSVAPREAVVAGSTPQNSGIAESESESVRAKSERESKRVRARERARE